MQMVYGGTRRDPSRILNVLLVLVILTSLAGAVCVGIGSKIGNNFEYVSSFGRSYWWGGVALVILGVLYIPCHILVKTSEGGCRTVFFLWTFFVCIGLIFILVSTVNTLILYRLIDDYNVKYCLYYTNSSNPPSPPSNLCKHQCDVGLKAKFGTGYSRICCCCDISHNGTGYKFAYAKGVQNCSVFTDNFGLTKALLAMYSVGLILILIDSIVACIITCGCCSVQTPWFQPVTMTATNVTFVTGQPRQPSYDSMAIPPKMDYA